MRKALLVALALVTLGSVAPANAAVKLIGCNDREALINFETPWAGCTPPE